MKITLLTGAAGDIQGWGNMDTTHAIATALEADGKKVDIFFATSYKELCQYLDERAFDIIWSSLYHISNNQSSIEVPTDAKWVQDYLDHYQAPYVGSSASSLKIMLNKRQTSAALNKHNIPVPAQFYIESVEALESLPKLTGQFIVKPCYGSNSTGIDETSVVCTPKQLTDKVMPILMDLSQPVVVEEYLPGNEYTVLMLGNTGDRHLYSVINVVDSNSYQQYPIITNALKNEHSIAFCKPTTDIQAMTEDLAYRTAEALDCRDHVRIDMRMDSQGELKIIDVNGIPGLSPILGSRSLAIQELYNPQVSKQTNYSRLINQIIEGAAQRYARTMAGLMVKN